MPSHPLNFNVVVITPPKLLIWPILSLNFIELHTSAKWIFHHLAIKYLTDNSHHVKEKKERDEER